ncbi:TonB-dependent receptor [Hymenobacter algoricola]|uniref:TonB-dependent receptor n=1 Tax=Hymenobacter algoricola TaxID=486267 RepID=A0ABP7MTF3_9BACT
MKHPYLLKLLFLLLFICAGSTGAFAQTGSVSGRVVDEKSEGMPGVTVLIEGTSLGNSTNADGTYTIQNVPAGPHTLVASFVGFNSSRKSVTIAAGQNVDVNVNLTENTTLLSEAVVVAYGTQERREVTGSVATIKADRILNNSVPSFDAALQGRASGLQVVQSNAAAGSAVRIRVRGTASITASGEPLYVIDGVPVDNTDISDPDFGRNSVKANNLNPLAAINPNDIESITVLKDASATALYGSRGANGVVLVTTKRGKSGKTTFNIGYYTGVSEATRRLPMLNGSEWLQLYNEARVNDGGTPLGPNESVSVNGITFTPNSVAGTNTDWIDQALRTGSVNDASVSAAGGNEKTRFFMGTGYRKEKGILQGNDFTRLSGRINLDHSATDKLDLGAQINLNYVDNNQVPTSFNGGIGTAQSSALPIFPVYNPDGTFFGTQLGNTGTNIVAQRENTYVSKGLRTLANLYGQYKIMTGLAFRSELGLDLFNQLERRYESPVNRYFTGVDANGVNLPRIGLGTTSERQLNRFNYNTNNLLTYEKSINEQNQLKLLLGFNAQKFNNHDLAASASNNAVGFVNPYFSQGLNNLAIAPGAPKDLSVATTGTSSRDYYTFLSYLGRVNYVFNNRYLFEASARIDGSSLFGPNNRYGFFPGASAGWIISEEAFMQNMSVVSFLKLHASYGLTGNANIPSFQYLGRYQQTGNYTGQPASGRSVLPNPDLSWEKNRAVDLGLDYGFLQGRISGSVAVYQKTSSDLLLNRKVPASAAGYSPSDEVLGVYINSGVVVRNRGVEFDVTSKNLVGDFSWTTSFNISHNSNIVTNNGGFDSPDFFGQGEGDTRIIQGQPIGISYVPIYAGVNPANGDELIFDKNTGEKIKLTAASQDVNRVATGRPFPRFTGGLENSFGYKGFDLSVLLSFSEGGQIYDDGAKYQQGGRIGSWNQRREVLNRWQKPGDDTDVPKVSLLEGGRADQSNSSRWLYDASYLRVRTASIGYTIPAAISQAAHIGSARIFVNGQNLFVFTKYAGWDPEVVRYNFSNGQGNTSFGAPYLPTPQQRVVTAGVNLTL